MSSEVINCPQMLPRPENGEAFRASGQKQSLAELLIV